MKLNRVRLVPLFFTVVFLLILTKGYLFLSSFVASTGISPKMFMQLVSGSIVDLRPIDGRVNVLVMGLAGGDHSGPNLTDTMVIFSFESSGEGLSMTSIPRDIWSDSLKDKINSAYHYGQERQEGGGLVLAKATLSDVVGLPVQYGIAFDFVGFIKIINLVGGIVVNVPVAFTDSQYPIEGKENDPCVSCRYEVLHFDPGQQHMDGNTALKYVRSRHAQGDEGTDFARARRQQDVIVALKEKLLSKDVVLNPQMYRKIIGIIDGAVDTDVKLGELLLLGKVFASIQSAAIARISLEDQLYAPPVNVYGRYVLLPKTSWEDIHAYIKAQLER